MAMKEKTFYNELPKEDELFDIEGYPSDKSLDYIANWSRLYNSTDLLTGKYYTLNSGSIETLIGFIKSIWWHSEDAIIEDDGLIEFHTFGWSGNEDIINELKKTLFWNTLAGYTSGGHYYFNLLPYSELEYKWVMKKEKV